jgi:hypothetical protein
MPPVSQASLAIKNVPRLFTLHMELCNIPGFETRIREEIDVCNAFMHKKFGKFSSF